MKRLVFAALAVTLLAAPEASAFDRYNAFTWQPSQPLEQTTDYIDQASGRGFGFDTRKFPRRDRNYSVGFSLAWHILDQKINDTIYLDNGAVTGSQRRYINSVPILLTGHLYLGNRRSSQLFFGAGAGAYYIIQTFDIGVWRVEESNWHFGVAPEIGFRFPFSTDVDLFLSAKYNYAVESGESITGEKVPYSYATFCVGLGGFD
jgi:hypothetical protein